MAAGSHSPTVERGSDSSGAALSSAVGGGRRYCLGDVALSGASDRAMSINCMNSAR